MRWSCDQAADEPLPARKAALVFIAAALAFNSYSGRFTVEGNQVHHDVEIALPDPRGWGDMVQRFRNVPVAADGRETALYARMLPGIVRDIDFATPPPEPELRPEPELNADSRR